MEANRHSTIGTRQTQYNEALPSSVNVQLNFTSSFADDGNASWHWVCRVPMVEWRLDCENCRHSTVVGLHDTGPWQPSLSYSSGATWTEALRAPPVTEATGAVWTWFSLAFLFSSISTMPSFQLPDSFLSRFWPIPPTFFFFKRNPTPVLENTSRGGGGGGCGWGWWERGGGTVL